MKRILLIVAVILRTIFSYAQCNTETTSAIVTVDGINILYNPNTLRYEDTLCLGESVTLAASTPSAAGETGTWTIISGTSVSLSSLASVIQPLTIHGTGSTTISWTINNRQFPACNPNVYTFTLVVYEKPSGGVIEGIDRLCEGTDTIFSVSSVNSSSYYSVYWYGDNGARRTGEFVSSSTSFIFSIDPQESSDTAIIRARPSNFCGSGPEISKRIKIKTAPRFTVTDSIEGPSEFPAILVSPVYSLSNTTPGYQYEWEWDHASIYVGTENSVAVDQPTRRSNTQSSVHLISVKATNECTASAQMLGILPPVISKQVKVISEPMGLEGTLRNEENYSLYPNPSLDGIFHLLNFKASDIVEVRDLTGQELEIRVRRDTKGELLDLSDQLKGIYFLINKSSGRTLKLINQ